MQIVYLSTRPSIFAETIASVGRYMTFIDRCVAMVPNHQLSEFTELNLKIPVTFVTDEQITGMSRSEIKDMGHQKRNYYLRRCLVEQPCIQEEFIMSDDDARPMSSIDAGVFKNEGKYRNYYYYDLALWRYHSTPFDIGQQNTCRVLQSLNLPHLSYASHMPQIINKKIYAEAGECFDSYSSELSLCEWACYFNFALSRYSEEFMSPQPYRTLCWPEYISSWPKYVEPENPVFENYTPQLYRHRGPFHGFQELKDSNLDTGLRKTLIWHQYESKVLMGELPEPQTVPRLFFHKMGRIAGKVKKLLFPEVKRMKIDKNKP